MKKIRYWLIQLLGISKSEANGTIFLISILFLIILTPTFIKFAFSNKYSSQLSDKLLLDSLLLTIEGTNEITHKEEENINFSDKNPPQNFDPNLASIDELVANGFSKRQAQNIYNYRESGGTFRIKKDLLKIYSVDSNLYLAIAPYLLLPDNHEKITKQSSAKKYSYIHSEKELIAFDINIADTAIIKQIRGIGSVLSNRIVKYREMLGGFNHINQLDEVYGLKDAPLEKLKELSFIGTEYSLKQININTANYFTLYQHVYINKKTANAIIEYRNQHSIYQSVDDLKNIHLISSELFEKVKPYLTTK
ncbi:MAG: helix-hairpin-helix domain-containing protein [Cyclobacteriaceae bacterium]|nr:helix-hairpin-helix domain-containing protein [Cyclobacteriaceae bacterium]